MAGEVLLRQGVKRRREILTFARRYIKKNGYAPSVIEIAEGIGVSKTAVRHHLVTLQDEGKIKVTEGRYRSLQLL